MIRRVIYYLFLLIIALFGVSFAVLNAEPVIIHFYIGQQQLPLSLLLVIALTLGGLCGLLVGLVLFFKMKRDNYKLSHRVKLAEREVDNLRSIPIKDAH